VGCFLEDDVIISSTLTKFLPRKSHAHFETLTPLYFSDDPNSFDSLMAFRLLFFSSGFLPSRDKERERQGRERERATRGGERDRPHTDTPLGGWKKGEVGKR
jgi:hypothetical protein